MSELNIGDILIAHNLITRAQYFECVEYQAQHPEETLLAVVLARGLCSKEAAMQAIGRYNSYTQTHPDPEESTAAFETAAQRFHEATETLAVLTERIKERS